jgi:hypothetical protein
MSTMHQKYAQSESSNKEAAPAGDAEDPRHKSPAVLTAPHPHIGPRRFSRPSLSPNPNQPTTTAPDLSSFLPLLLFPSPNSPISPCSPPVPTSPVSGPVHAARRCTCCLASHRECLSPLPSASLLARLPLLLRLFLVFLGVLASYAY